MSQSNSAEDFQRYIDEQFPFIGANEEPPGRWSENAALRGAKTWQGKHGWRTRHGEAVVRWSLGKPSHITSARYPDGSRGEANDTLDHGFRRRGAGDKLWIYGRIEINPDDVVFVDGEQPVYKPLQMTDIPNLEADLAGDKEFRAAIQNDRFAFAVYHVFTNRTFLKVSGNGRWDCGDRQAANLVAHLRDRGESYHDYFLRYDFEGTYPDDRSDLESPVRAHIKMIEDIQKRGVPGTPEYESFEKTKQALQKRISSNENADVLDSLRSHLTRLGWRTETGADRRGAREAALRESVVVLQEVRELEKQPEGIPGDWVEAVKRQRQAAGMTLIAKATLEKASPDEQEVLTGRLRARLFALAISGRITKQEYEALRSRMTPK